MFVCPNCVEAELDPIPDESGWLECPGCGLQFNEDYLAELDERAHNKEIRAQVRECLREDARKNHGKGRSSKSHGKDDKLGTRSIATLVYDDAMLSQKVEALDPKSVVLRLPNLGSIPSEALRAALFLYCEHLRREAEHNEATLQQEKG